MCLSATTHNQTKNGPDGDFLMECVIAGQKFRPKICTQWATNTVP